MGKLLFNSNQKNVFMCGDLNTDLLNPKNNTLTEEFINTMYTIGMQPLITRPSRITTHSAMLIDNI